LEEEKRECRELSSLSAPISLNTIQAHNKNMAIFQREIGGLASSYHLASELPGLLFRLQKDFEHYTPYD
jgi:hypothetical protein